MDNLSVHDFGDAGYQPKVCSVDGCSNRMSGRGFCKSHYARYKRHGDPLAGKKMKGKPAVRGAPLKWIEEHLSHSGTECLKWPFSDDSHGYGQINYKGKVTKAYIVMCLLKHGPKPSPLHQAAHSCGRGKYGCTHPEHLRWATQSENELDKALHGTDLRGEKHHNCKLKKDDVLKIRAMLGDHSNSEVARLFGVARKTICDIRHRRNWAWLD